MENLCNDVDYRHKFIFYLNLCYFLIYLITMIIVLVKINFKLHFSALTVMVAYLIMFALVNLSDFLRILKGEVGFYFIGIMQFINVFAKKVKTVVIYFLANVIREIRIKL